MGEEKSKKNRAVNILKGIACIAVVFIHVRFPGRFGNLVATMGAFAVPVFFMIAGYYSYGMNRITISRRCCKILRIFACAYVLALGYNLIFIARYEGYLNWFLRNYTWLTPIKYCLFCAVDFAIPLWYLIAMAEIYIFWSWIIKKEYETLMLRYMPILFIIQLLLTMICEGISLEWYFKVNFLTYALPWFLLGYFLRTKKASLALELKKCLLIISFGGCLLVIIPSVLEWKFKFNVVGSFFMALGLFLLALNQSKEEKKNSNWIIWVIEVMGEKLSMVIYITHYIVVGVLDFGVGHINSKIIDQGWYLWTKPIVVLVISCLVGLGYIIIQGLISNEKK